MKTADPTTELNKGFNMLLKFINYMDYSSIGFQDYTAQFSMYLRTEYYTIN
jgi:hypothetical protein